MKFCLGIIVSLTLSATTTVEASVATFEKVGDKATEDVSFLEHSVQHKIPSLCWNSGEEDATTVFLGRPCCNPCGSGYPETKVQWEIMRTVDSAGKTKNCGNGTKAYWERSNNGLDWEWNTAFLGSCGSSPALYSLPENIGDVLDQFTYTVDHTVSPDCLNTTDGGPPETVYKGTSCPDDPTKIIWNRMETINAVDREACHWNRKSSDQQFNDDWLGSCGVPPVFVQELPIDDTTLPSASPSSIPSLAPSSSPSSHAPSASPSDAPTSVPTVTPPANDLEFVGHGLCRDASDPKKGYDQYAVRYHLAGQASAADCGHHCQQDWRYDHDSFVGLERKIVHGFGYQTYCYCLFDAGQNWRLYTAGYSGEGGVGAIDDYYPAGNHYTVWHCHREKSFGRGPTATPTAYPSNAPSIAPTPVPTPSPTINSCTRPTGWCTGSGYVYKQVDCNGDGVMDHACYGINGERGTLLSGTDCSGSLPTDSAWPSATASSCPAAFGSCERGSWCTHANSVYKYWDCTGNGKPQHICYDYFFGFVGSKGFMLDGSTCQSNWPNAVTGSCPGVF